MGQWDWVSVMWKRITIVRGLLAVGLLDFPLYRENGTAFEGDYSGDAFVSDGHVGIAPRGTWDVNPVRLKIADGPTQASADRAAGTDLAMQQKRQVWPNGKSEAFVDAWKAAWLERGRPVRGFIEHNGRVMKESSAKRARLA